MSEAVRSIAAAPPAEAGGGALVEREWELACLRSTGKRALAGRGGVVIVEGAAGIGKTTLLNRTCEDAAARGFDVVRARGDELEPELPYGVMRQFFERPLQRLRPDERAQALAGAATHARTALGLASAVVDTYLPRGDESLAVRHGLYWLIANLADRRPLALVLDDAHSADPSSLEALVYLASRLEGLRVLVCLGARMDEAPPLLERLAADPEAVAVRPPPLTPTAAGDVVEALLGVPVAAEFAASCHAATGGNPFLLRELATALRAEGIDPTAAQRQRVSQVGPRTVARAVLLRLAALPTGADRLARAVAVLGSHAEPHLVTRLTALEPESAAGTLDALRQAEILAGDRPVAFAHPIVRAAIYGDIPVSERARLHAQAAEVLVAAAVDREDVATHLLASEPRGRADVVEWLRSAARIALQQGVPDAAYRWLKRALAEPPPPGVRPHVLAEAGMAAWRAGGLAAATNCLREAIAAMPLEAERARAGLLLAQATWARDGVEAALAVLDGAIADATPQDAELALQLEAELAVLAYVAGELAPALRQRMRPHERLPGATAAERALLGACACARVARDGSATQTITLGRRAFDVSVEAEIPASAVALSCAYALIVADDVELPAAILAAMQTRADRDGSVFEFVGTSVVRSLLRLHEGRVLQAEADARAVLEALEATTGHRGAAPPALAVVLEALIEQGRLDEAETELQAAGLAGDLPPGAPFSRLRFARSRLRLAQQRWDQALTDARAVGHSDESGGMLNPGARWRSVAALACHSAGRGDEAIALADEQIAVARAWGARSFAGEALRVRALVGDPRETLDRLGEAVALLERSPAALEHARALVDLGAALRRERLRSRSRAVIERALATLDGRGADALVARAQAELELMGDRPRERARSGTDALTPAERRVAELAAQKLSNRQIAQTLFLTPKTVENHLGRIYFKLSIHARDELPAALARQS